MSGSTARLTWMASVARFLRRRIGELRKGGLPVISRNARTLVLAPLVMPLVLAMRAARPVIVIRIGALTSNRIGHFAPYTELYLCQRDVGTQNKWTVDIFYHMPPVCNQQLKDMWGRTLRVSRFASLLDRYNRWLPGYQAHMVPMRMGRDVHGLLARTSPHLCFTPEEERRGREELVRMGIDEGTHFICFAGRDPAYLDSAFPVLAKSAGWGYHDYRDSSIHNYELAGEEMVHRGYVAIRMGAVVKEALHSHNPRIIDYASNGMRNDFLDIFLGAKCRFFIGGGSGLDAIPMIFRRPVCYVNHIPMEYVHTWLPHDLLIFKKLWLPQEGRFMTFREIFESGVGRYLRSVQYEQAGIDIVENTSEEITSLAVEMDERLNGTWQTTEEDEELQRQFWALFKPSELNGGVLLSRIGAEFLRQNRELLD